MAHGKDKNGKGVGGSGSHITVRVIFITLGDTFQRRKRILKHIYCSRGLMVKWGFSVGIKAG